MQLIIQISVIVLTLLGLSEALTLPQLCKSKQFGYKLQDPEDCHGFYVCLGNLGQFSLDCGQGFRFNETQQKCIKGKCPPCPCLAGQYDTGLKITGFLPMIPFRVDFNMPVENNNFTPIDILNHDSIQQSGDGIEIQKLKTKSLTLNKLTNLSKLLEDFDINMQILSTKSPVPLRTLYKDNSSGSIINLSKNILETPTYLPIQSTTDSSIEQDDERALSRELTTENIMITTLTIETTTEAPTSTGLTTDLSIELTTEFINEQTTTKDNPEHSSTILPAEFLLDSTSATLTEQSTVPTSTASPTNPTMLPKEPTITTDLLTTSVLIPTEPTIATGAEATLIVEASAIENIIITILPTEPTTITTDSSTLSATIENITGTILVTEPTIINMDSSTLTATISTESTTITTDCSTLSVTIENITITILPTEPTTITTDSSTLSATIENITITILSTEPTISSTDSSTLTATILPTEPTIITTDSSTLTATIENFTITILPTKPTISSTDSSTLTATILPTEPTIITTDSSTLTATIENFTITILSTEPTISSTDSSTLTATILSTEPTIGTTDSSTLTATIENFTITILPTKPTIINTLTALPTEPMTITTNVPTTTMILPTTTIDVWPTSTIVTLITEPSTLTNTILNAATSTETSNISVVPSEPTTISIYYSSTLTILPTELTITTIETTTELITTTATEVPNPTEFPMGSTTVTEPEPIITPYSPAETGTETTTIPTTTLATECTSKQTTNSSIEITTMAKCTSKVNTSQCSTKSTTSKCSTQIMTTKCLTITTTKISTTQGSTKPTTKYPEMSSCAESKIKITKLTVNTPNICDNHKDGHFIRDPRNCKMYYSCYRKRAYHQSCPGEFYFDAKLQMCNYPDLVDCPQLINVTPDISRSSEIPSKYLSIYNSQAQAHNELMPTDCKTLKSGTFIRDPGDCNKYYVCLNGNAIKLYCPRGQYFDIENYVCNFKFLVKNCASYKL